MRSTQPKRFSIGPRPDEFAIPHDLRSNVDVAGAPDILRDVSIHGPVEAIGHRGIHRGLHHLGINLSRYSLRDRDDSAVLHGRSTIPRGRGAPIRLGSWAAGSIYARTAPLPRSPRLATAMEMLIGGGLLLLVGGLAGEWGTISIAAISAKSLLALAYLIVFGAIIAFSAYIWLLLVSTPARVATYAYVNPVVALFLGWALAAEPLDPQALTAGGIILSAVWAISLHGGGKRPARTGCEPVDSQV